MGKRVLDFTLIVLSCISIFMTGLYIYLMVKDKGLYTTSTATYVTSVTDPLTGDEYAPFEVNVYNNVVDFRINCYSDANKTALYPRGYQLIINEKGDNELYYYDTFNGESFESANPYDETNSDGQHREFYYIDIEDELYAIRLDGTYVTTERNILKTIGNSIWNFIQFKWKADSTVYDYITHYYTMEDLMLKMKTILASSSYGVGDFEMPLIDLGDYLHVYSVENGKVSEEPLGNKDSLANSYFSMSCHYHKRNMTYANQSLFKSVAGDNDFNVSGINFDVDYWKATQEYHITENDFVSRYSVVDDGFYFSLSNDLISELKNYSSLEIYIDFNLTNLGNIKILGFDYYALNGLDIEQLTITSDIHQEFVVMYGSLGDYQIENIIVNNVTLIEEGVQEYEVV